MAEETLGQMAERALAQETLGRDIEFALIRNLVAIVNANPAETGATRREVILYAVNNNIPLATDVNNQK